MRVAGLFLISTALGVGTAWAGEPVDLPVRGWEAPRFFQPAAVSPIDRPAGTLEAVAERASDEESLSGTAVGSRARVELSPTPSAPTVVSSTPLIFVAVTPCRVLDTRGISPPTPPYGAPSLSSTVVREFQITGKCGIPAGAGAVSTSAAVTNTGGAGFLALWEGGGAAWPGNASVNYSVGQTVNNAAIVPLSATGTISAMTFTTGTGLLDFILDVNGYYTADPTSGPFVSYTVTGTAQTFPANFITTLNLALPVSVSTDGVGLVTTGASWHFTAPKPGVYEVTVRCAFAPVTWVNAVSIFVGQVNGSTVAEFGGRDVTAGYNKDFLAEGVWQAVVNANDTISVAFFHNNNVTLTREFASVDNMITIRFIRPFP